MTKNKAVCCAIQVRTVVSGCKAVVMGSASDRACRTASRSTTVRRLASAVIRRHLSLPSTPRPSTTTTMCPPPPQAEAATRAVVALSWWRGPTRRDSWRRLGRREAGFAEPWHGHWGCGSKWVPVRRRSHGRVSDLGETVREVDQPAKTASHRTQAVVRASLARYHQRHHHHHRYHRRRCRNNDNICIDASFVSVTV